MDKFVAFLENNLSTPMAKLSEQKHLRAIRDGVVSALPFIIFGSLFLIIAFPPVAADTALGEWSAKHIAEILIPYRHKIAVNTIDSFQGQERDVVYISLTRSNGEGSIGFLSDTRRMNVAMTRARKKLVVIGDSATLSKSNFYAEFIQYAEQLNAYHSAWEFMEL